MNSHRECCEDRFIPDVSLHHEGDHIEAKGKCTNCEAVHIDVFRYSETFLWNDYRDD